LTIFSFIESITYTSSIRPARPLAGAIYNWVTTCLKKERKRKKEKKKGKKGKERKKRRKEKKE
jgi:hypothetical protein